MKKRTVTILFWILSILYFYFINIHLFWINESWEINNYKWGNSYANETRNYFLFDGISATYARDWDYFNFIDEPIYFENFDFLINSNGEPYSLMSSQSKCTDRGFCDLNGGCPYARNCSVPFSINEFTGEAIKLHESHCNTKDEEGCLNYRKSGPTLWGGIVASKRIYTFLSAFDQNLSEFRASSIDEIFKRNQIKSNSFSENNIKCKMSFKNGKAHGKKIIYNDPVFYFDSIGKKYWNDHLHFYKRKPEIKIPYFIINVSGFEGEFPQHYPKVYDYDLHDNYKEESGYQYYFISDSIIENYNEGLLTDLEIWRTNCTLIHRTNLHKNVSILSPPTVRLEIIKPDKPNINYNFKNYNTQNQDLLKYNHKFEWLNEKLTFKFEKPELIHESHNSNGVLNPVQLHFKENEFKSDPRFKLNWKFLNKYADIKPYLLFYLFGQSILVFGYFLIRKKLAKI